jgi:hypothetical protein
MQSWRRRYIAVASLLLTATAAAEEVTFRRAVELALKNSTTTAIAEADQQRAK